MAKYEVGDKIWVRAEVVEVDKTSSGGQTFCVELSDEAGTRSDRFWMDDTDIGEQHASESTSPLQRVFDDLRKLGIVR